MFRNVHVFYWHLNTLTIDYIEAHSNIGTSTGMGEENYVTAYLSYNGYMEGIYRLTELKDV